MTGLPALLRSFQLESLGEGRYSAPNAPEGPGIVFGGQLIAQSIVVAALDHPGKAVKTVHTVFARAASFEPDLDIEVEVMQSGRAFGSSTVTISQEGKLRTRSVVLMTAEEPDLIRHQAPMPDLAEPTGGPSGDGADDWDVRIVGDVDINDPSLVGPAELDVWTRFAAAPDDDPIVAQALVAYTTDPFLIATAMRPHEGVGQALAHVSLSTGVISHTITFHEPVHANRWLLLSHESPYAGHGRSYGRAHVFQGGALVASFVQDNMIRAIPDGKAPGHL
jgi:acyl-CoA thioesterase-2